MDKSSTKLLAEGKARRHGGKPFGPDNPPPKSPGRPPADPARKAVEAAVKPYIERVAEVTADFEAAFRQLAAEAVVAIREVLGQRDDRAARVAAARIALDRGLGPVIQKTAAVNLNLDGREEVKRLTQTDINALAQRLLSRKA